MKAVFAITYAAVRQAMQRFVVKFAIKNRGPIAEYPLIPQ